MELIRFAIEKGQPLGPEVMEILFKKSRIALFAPGIVTIAAGIGILVFSLFLAQITTRGAWAGAGALAICVGAGMVISHRLVHGAEQEVAKS